MTPTGAFVAGLLFGCALTILAAFFGVRVRPDDD